MFYAFVLFFLSSLSYKIRIVPAHSCSRADCRSLPTSEGDRTSLSPAEAALHPVQLSQPCHLLILLAKLCTTLTSSEELREGQNLSLEVGRNFLLKPVKETNICKWCIGGKDVL